MSVSPTDKPHKNQNHNINRTTLTTTRMTTIQRDKIHGGNRLLKKLNLIDRKSIAPIVEF